MSFTLFFYDWTITSAGDGLSEFEHTFGGPPMHEGAQRENCNDRLLHAPYSRPGASALLCRHRHYALGHLLLNLAAAAGWAGKLFVPVVVLVPVVFLKGLQGFELLSTILAGVIVIRHGTYLHSR
jgi:hypothetical protein